MNIDTSRPIFGPSIMWQPVDDRALVANAAAAVIGSGYREMRLFAPPPHTLSLSLDAALTAHLETMIWRYPALVEAPDVFNPFPQVQIPIHDRLTFYPWPMKRHEAEYLFERQGLDAFRRHLEPATIETGVAAPHITVMADPLRDAIESLMRRVVKGRRQKIRFKKAAPDFMNFVRIQTVNSRKIRLTSYCLGEIESLEVGARVQRTVDASANIYDLSALLRVANPEPIYIRDESCNKNHPWGKRVENVPCMTFWQTRDHRLVFWRSRLYQSTDSLPIPQTSERKTAS